ncbi:hypothetical protein [Bacillus pumilus]|uniref:hypothetical protein n=1 Tax=Bacillus TaxID=1386 RepID=UPI0015D566C1|nr:hypothetical protein [Bacillus pumilus]MEB2356758.1 hypothetical protein [Bacillus pumilus]QLI76445.1 hypothetical protein HZ310_00950 [Bacillus pumilus]
MKNLFVVLTILLFSISSLFVGGNYTKAEVQKEDKLTVSKANEIAKKYGFDIATDAKKNPENSLDFNSVEEFEKFLKEENAKASNGDLENDETDQGVIGNTVKALAAKKAKAKKSTKTYSFKEHNGVGYIASYARVTRVGSKVSGVKVWSEQVGLMLAITWTEKSTWHKLNAKKTGGKAYVRGTKLYGMNVVGQSVGYSKVVTFTVKF